jgi:hypothetical protein
MIQIVAQTIRRSGWRVYRTLAALVLRRSVYYAWKRRESLEDRAGGACRVYNMRHNKGVHNDCAIVRKLNCHLIDAWATRSDESIGQQRRTCFE